LPYSGIWLGLLTTSNPDYKKVQVEFSGTFWTLVDIAALLFVIFIYFSKKRRITFVILGFIFAAYSLFAVLNKSALTSVAQSAIKSGNNSKGGLAVAIESSLLDHSFVRIGIYGALLALLCFVIGLFPKRKKVSH
jgi:mannose/fructose/N-acetylgalactosamine-specific phosphotransferase system component IIC